MSTHTLPQQFDLPTKTTAVRKTEKENFKMQEVQLDEKLTLTRPGRPTLEYLPIGLFGSVLGLTGLSVAWQIAATHYALPHWIADAIGFSAIVAFVLLCFGYAWKIAMAPQAVRAEFRHPIAGNLFGTFFISLLLLPIVLSRINLLIAQVSWVVGAAGMIGFAFLIVNRWFSDRHQIAHATPAWIIPVVGLLDLPLALPYLALPPMPGLGMFAVSVGLFFTIPLFTLIFSRLVFEEPMPEALRPSLMILVAPFAVGHSAYTTVAGAPDRFSDALYMLTLFILAVSLGQMRFLRKCCPFRVSWWAVSFPLAASAIAALHFAETSSNLFSEAVALALLALATVVITGLFTRTLTGLARSELRTLSG